MQRVIAGTVLLTISGIATASVDGQQVLWDNGPFGPERMSHLSGKGQRRSVLDDFTVDGTDAWSISRVGIVFTWNTLSWGYGTDFEVTFYGDAGGEPDFDAVIAIANNRVYSETLWQCTSICWGEVAVEFDPVVLTPGVYWADFHVVAPRNGFQFVSQKMNGGPAWVDYEDFGGRQPARNIFGADYDVNFVLGGEVIPAPGVAVMFLSLLAAQRRRWRPT